jgi:hypothetical protein
MNGMAVIPENALPLRPLLVNKKQPTRRWFDRGQRRGVFHWGLP